MQRLSKIKIICIIIIIIISIIVYKLITKEEYIESSFETTMNQESLEISNKTIKDDINKIVIYVTGAVNKEGIYEVDENSRIADAIEIAGGLTENANIKNINLAYTIEDGMKIHIPTINENQNLEQDDTENCITREDSSSADLNKNSSAKKININTATQSELEKIPGVGSATAIKIMEYRKENGKFKSIEDIKNVNGIGESKFLKMQQYIEI